MDKRGIILSITLLAILTLPIIHVVAQPSESEARQKFEALGCTSCHNGGVAPTWDTITKDFKAWRGEYKSLDDAVRSEVKYFGGQTFNSFDELMKTMAQNVGKDVNDPDMQIITQYLKTLYTGGKQTTTTKTTQTTQTTQTTTKTGIKGGTEPKTGLYTTIITTIIIIIIALAAAIYLTKR